MHDDTWQLLEASLGPPPLLRARDTPTEHEIQNAANHLRVVFPPDYVEFLRRLGGAMVGPYPVYGLRAADVMDSRDVIELNEFYRRDWGISADDLVVSMDHAGNPFVVLSTGRVVRPDHDAGATDDIASTFEEFLLYCMRRSAE